MARLILDTGVLIEIDRGAASLYGAIHDDDNIALPAVVIAEFLTGVAAQQSPARRASGHQFLEELREAIPVVAYDAAIAESHAELLTYVRNQGTPRGAHDLIIAATARATDRILITTDRKARFDDLPGVNVRIISN